MHGNIPFMFDFWADLVIQLLLLKSSMVYLRIDIFFLSLSVSVFTYTISEVLIK